MKIVYTSGTFDLIHIGHLNVIKRSKALGDYLIVAVSTDELVESYKKHRPIIGLEERAELVRHLRCVDQVVIQDELFSRKLMLKHGVNIMTIGSDWMYRFHEGLECAKNDPQIEVAFLPYTNEVSTTVIRKAVVDVWQEDHNDSVTR
jgi:glycerol-3-phosphate cytidylyltransferase